MVFLDVIPNVSTWVRQRRIKTNIFYSIPKNLWIIQHFHCVFDRIKKAPPITKALTFFCRLFVILYHDSCSHEFSNSDEIFLRYFSIFLLSSKWMKMDFSAWLIVSHRWLFRFWLMMMIEVLCPSKKLFVNKIKRN